MPQYKNNSKYKTIKKQVSAATRYDPRIGRRVSVRNYSRDQYIRDYKTISLKIAEKAFEERSKRAKTLDKKKESKETLEEPNEKWLENINRLDVRGIDTPESVRKRYQQIDFSTKINNLEEMASQFEKVNDLLYYSAMEHLNKEQINKLKNKRKDLLNYRKEQKENYKTKLYKYSNADLGIYISEREDGSIEVAFDYPTYRDDLSYSDKEKWRPCAKWDGNNNVWNVYKNKKEEALELLHKKKLIPEKPKAQASLREQYLPKEKQENSIVIEIDDKGAKIDGDYNTLKKISDHYSYYMKGYKYSKAYKEGKWDGKIRIMRLGSGTIPENLAYNILEEKDKILSEQNINIKILDFRKNVIRQNPYKIKDIKLYDYQQEAVRIALDEKQGLIAVATGGGKTEIASGIIAEYGEDNDSIFLVHTTALQDQAEQRLEKRLGKDVGVGGGVRHEIKDTEKGDVNVVTLQSLHNAIKTKKEGKTLTEKQKELLKIYRDAELIIQDEAHHVKAETFKEVFDEGKTKHKFGLSATPFRDENDEKEVFSRFGKKIVDIPVDDLIEKGRLVAPTIHMLEIPSSKETNFIMASFKPGTKKYNAIRRTQIINNKTRNDLIKNIAEEQEKKGKTNLIFVDRIQHGDKLSQLLGTPFLNGQNQSIANREKNRKIIQRVEKGEIKTIVATQQLFGEGFDLPAIDSLIIADAGGMSKVKTMQRAGRALRTKKGKESTDIFDFKDKTEYLNEHASERLKTYKENKKFKIIEHKGPESWRDILVKTSMTQD